VVGTLANLDVAEAKSALSWWLEAGVDALVDEAPRDWLAPSKLAADPISASSNVKIPEPETLEALKDWLATGADLPLASPAARRALPHGPEQAAIMLLSEAPTAEDAAEDQPIGGNAWRLAIRMLAAIGLTPDQAYSASLSCFHAPGKKMTASERELCAEIARRHVRLARPKGILLLGDGPCLALLGKRLVDARGHLHKIEGVRAVATFHPRHLIHRPLDKPLAWKDLLLLTEDEG
jgi:DNA polymerase